MILPAWTQSRTQPVHISDVTKALVGALETDELEPGVYDIPGPDVLSVEEIFRHTARILNNNTPIGIRVPLLTPKLSSYWLRFVTRSDYSVASELVNGLKSDLLARDERFWTIINHENRIGFDEAVSQTLREEEKLPLPARIYEKIISLSTRLTGTKDVA
jgi:nucleoside-diphosphate-sugar epimerase